MKNFPSSYPTDHHGLTAESRQYALPVRDQTVSYRRKQITQWNCSGMMLLQMKNEKQQICDLMVDLTEHEMIATDDTQPRKLDISFVLYSWQHRMEERGTCDDEFEQHGAAKT